MSISCFSLLFSKHESLHHSIYFFSLSKNDYFDIKYLTMMYRLKSTDSYATLAIIIKGVYLFVRHITTSISFLFILIKSTCIIEGDNNIVKDEENEGGGAKIQFVCWSTQLPNIGRWQQQGEIWKKKKKCNQPNIETFTH